MFSLEIRLVRTTRLLLEKPHDEHKKDNDSKHWEDVPDSVEQLKETAKTRSKYYIPGSRHGSNKNNSKIPGLR